MNKLIEKLNSLDDFKNKKIPNRKEIITIIKLIQALLFPTVYNNEIKNEEDILNELKAKLKEQLLIAFNYEERDCCDYECIISNFLSSLSEIKKTLLTDIEAIYNGDPACKSKEEVLICYPGFYAISIYRIAHELVKLNIPYIPRIMSEFAHEKTGIDINPGAIIGNYFCIDHGTGIVIGETAIIGNNVKLYQGVTIGAKSFTLDNNGNPIKGGKRHPTIKDNVIIYANATILGGDTIIGNNSVIGGNTFITHSVKDNEKIIYNN